MNQSFRNRLARLEALEAAADAVRGPGALTNDDCATLLTQMSMSNVRLVSGRAVRQWLCDGDATNAAIDVALLRLNILLIDEPDGPTSSAELACVLAQYVEDDAVSGWVWGLLYEKRLLPALKDAD